jgi:hypothetical protein
LIENKTAEDDVNVRIYGSFRGHSRMRAIHATSAGC